MIAILVDADACPVKDEIYSVAARHGIQVYLVANSPIRVPPGLGVEMILVEKGPDVADDCIAAEVRSGDVVITADIPLAARCIEAGGRVLGNNGRPFTEESIGGALATRDLMSDLREAGVVGGGPRPMSQRDRSRFAQSLEEMVRESLQELET